MLVNTLFLLIPLVNSLQHHEIKTPLTVANPATVVQSVVERIQTQNVNREVFGAVRNIKRTFRHPGRYLKDTNNETQCFKDLTVWENDLGKGSHYALQGKMFCFYKFVLIQL